MPSSPFLSPATGFVAQLVDGGLGMGFGPVAMAFLLGLGIAPVVAGASVNLAALGSGLVGAAAHHRFGNVHWPTAARLGVPGAVGAFAGAWALVSLASVDAATPVTSGVLVVVGAAIVWRFARGSGGGGRVRHALAAPTGLAGGFLAAAGGGWGAVVTPVVLATSRLSPRHVVGSVSAARVGVAGAAVLGFWWALPSSVTVLWPLVAAMMVGGAVAAPVAAWLASRVPAQALGATVGMLVVSLHLRALLGGFSVPPQAVWALYGVLAALWVAALAWPSRRRAALPEAGPAVAAEPVRAEA